jgi:hypothetical protein
MGFGSCPPSANHPRTETETPRLLLRLLRLILPKDQLGLEERC